MRSTNTFGVQFIIRKNKLNGGLAPIYARITANNQRVEVSMKRRIHPSHWNSSRGVAKGSREEIKSLNRYLDEVRARIVESYQEMHIKKQLITADAIKSMLVGTEDKEHTLIKLVDFHNTSFKGTLADGTLKNYYTTHKYIQRFLKARYSTTDLFLSELSYKFITDFELYLRNYKPKDHQKPLSNNGVMKHLERFRKLINLAVRMEWMAKNPFEKYQLKFTRVDKGYLSAEELARIEYKEFKISRLGWVRDLFIFSCYTGLAYIDLMNLTPNKISIGIDGEYWLTTRRQNCQSGSRFFPRRYRSLINTRNIPEPSPMVAYFLKSLIKN